MNDTQVSTFSLTPANLSEAMELAELMAKSEMVPRQYVGKPGNVLVAVQMGADLGLKPMAAIQNIAVVNGNPCLWGDGLRAVVLGSPDLVEITEDYDEATMTATCIIIREMGRNKKQSKFVGKFSKTDAEVAGLWGRNTWKSYPKRMLQWRAFGLSARDAYADRLKGIKLAEEVQDYPVEERDITPRTNRVNPNDLQQIQSKEKEVIEPDNEVSRYDEISSYIEAADTLSALEAAAETISEDLDDGRITQEQREKLIPIYRKRKAELEGK